MKSAAEAAVLEAPGDYAVSFYYTERPNSLLKNFIIRNSSTGIFIVGSAPAIRNLTIVDNNNLGIEAWSGSNPSISNCILWNNGIADLYGCEAEYSFVEDEVNKPIACWGFDEGSGNTAHDLVGNNDGTLVNGPIWTDGQVGGALSFDGLDDYVLGSSSPFDFADTTFTVSAWFKTTGGSGVIVSEGAYLNGGWHLAIKDGAIGVMLKEGSIQACDAYSANTMAGNYNDGEWHHVTAVVTTDTADALGNSAQIYVDGGPATIDEAKNYAYASSSDNWAIGARATGHEPYFNGLIDEVLIHNKGLSAEEVKNLYQSGLKGQICPISPLFADANNGDYHLLSERGRYWAEHDVWVLDKVTSPCVDGGDPTRAPSNEPMPNGARINMGAYGDTPYASMSEWAIEGDFNHDGIVNFVDFAIMADNWLRSTEWFQQ